MKTTSPNVTLVTKQAFVATWCLLFLDFIELYFLQSDCVLLLGRFSECTIVIVGPRYLYRMAVSGRPLKFTRGSISV